MEIRIKFIWAIEVYVIIRFKSVWRVAVAEEYMIDIPANIKINGVKYTVALGNGIRKRSIP